MTAYNQQLVVTDPDALSYDVNVPFVSSTSDVIIDTSQKVISLKVGTNITESGATLKAVYSKLKDAWKEHPLLIKYPFPMYPITDEQYELSNGWNFDSLNASGAEQQTTPQLLRSCGWVVLNSSGNVTESWAGVITLGELPDDTNVYYQLGNQSEAAVDFVLSGNVNQAIMVYNDPNGDGSLSGGFDARSYIKIFFRKWNYTYDQITNADIGVSSLSYQAYRFPLVSIPDVFSTVEISEIDPTNSGLPSNGVYGNVRITFLRNLNGDMYEILGDWNALQSYALTDVVRSGINGRWYKRIDAGTSPLDPAQDSDNWSPYEGERLIAGQWYAFYVIIDGDTTTSGAGLAPLSQIYEAVQYHLINNVDIDESINGSVIGKTQDELLVFRGQNLITSRGVYVDSVSAEDLNDIIYTDVFGVEVANPFVSAITLIFSPSIYLDRDSKYWIFFENVPGGEFGEPSSKIVLDSNGDEMSGKVNPSWPSIRTQVSHSFDFDSSTQYGRIAGENFNVVAVAIGLSSGTYAISTATITRSNENRINVFSELELNYIPGEAYDGD